MPWTTEGGSWSARRGLPGAVDGGCERGMNCPWVARMRWWEGFWGLRMRV